MQDKTFYRIIYLQNSKSNRQDERDIIMSKILPNQYNNNSNKKTQMSSVAHLSSLLQTQNKNKKQLLAREPHFTERKIEKHQTTNYGMITAPQLYDMKNSKPEANDQIVKYFKHKMNNMAVQAKTLTHIVRQLPSQNTERRHASSMQDTIKKARTHKIMPLSNKNTITFQKINERRKMKAQFNDYIAKRDQKYQQTNNQMNRKRQLSQKFNAVKALECKEMTSQSNTTDLYNFLKTSKTKRQKLKPAELDRIGNNIISKRMQTMALKTELGIDDDDRFQWTHMRKKDSYKLKTMPI